MSLVWCVTWLDGPRTQALQLLSLSSRHSKCHLFYTIMIWGWNFLPNKVRDFYNTKFTITRLKWQITPIPLKYTNNSLELHDECSCTVFPGTFIQKYWKIINKNYIYAKTVYVQLKRLPKAWKLYTSAACYACDI